MVICQFISQRHWKYTLESLLLLCIGSQLSQCKSSLWILILSDMWQPSYVIDCLTSIWFPYLTVGCCMEGFCQKIGTIGISSWNCSAVWCRNGCCYLCSYSISVMVPICLNFPISSSIQSSIQQRVGNLPHPCREQGKCASLNQSFCYLHRCSGAMVPKTTSNVARQLSVIYRIYYGTVLVFILYCIVLYHLIFEVLIPQLFSCISFAACYRHQHHQQIFVEGRVWWRSCEGMNLILQEF